MYQVQAHDAASEGVIDGALYFMQEDIVRQLLEKLNALGLFFRQEYMPAEAMVGSCYSSRAVVCLRPSFLGPPPPPPPGTWAAREELG